MDNVSNKKDVFEILGISNKEDCFTNLIAETFNESGSREFRNQFCRAISNNKTNIYDSADAKIYTRNVFNVESTNENGGRSKIVPDILFVAPSQNVIVIIENKIFSDEGFKQTLAYSSIEFQNELIKLYSSNDAHNYKFEFYYMTLLGKKASSDMFSPLKWTDFIIDTCKDIEFVSPYNILISDMVSRATELKYFIDNLLEGNNNTFNDYYMKRSRWINAEVVFKKYFTPILENIKETYNVNYEFGEAKGRVPQLLILLYRDDWRKNSLDDYVIGEPLGRFEHTRNIHLEFTWHVGLNDASFMIHYEPFPYYPNEKFKDKYPNIEQIYAVHRKLFKENMDKLLRDSKHWEKVNYRLAMAKKNFKNFMNLNIDEFTEDFNNAFSEAYSIINDLLEKE